MSTRATPAALLFADCAAETWPAVRRELEELGRPATDRDAFLMTRAAVQLVQRLRPEGGFGDAIDEVVALAHHAWLAWAAGDLSWRLGRAACRRLLAEPGADDGPDAPVSACYIQFPERTVWATPVAGSPPEPLDGLFLAPSGDGSLLVLGVFGLHPSRFSLSLVEVGGVRPRGLRRPDGTPLFAPVLAGGDRAGLFSLTGAEELLALGWRSLDLVRTAPAPAPGGVMEID